MSLLDTCSSLLGSSDERNIQVLVCTANIGNEAPNLESMSEWIPNDGDTKSVLENQQYPVRVGGELTPKAVCETRDYPSLEINNSGSTHGADYDKFHIIAIGMQEATFEVSEELTKSFASDAEQKEKNCDCHNGQDDTRLLHQMLRTLLPSYTRAVSYQRGQMRLMIFYKNQISFNLLSVKAQNTGKGGRNNKGGIVAECEVGPGTRISFLTAHLEAHEGLEKYETRCKTISDIFGGTASNSCFDVSQTSHFTFAMGDLNFRTRLPNYEIGSEEHIQASHRLAEQRDWDILNEHDELARALRNKECLAGFCTPRCDFPPTFKIERKDGYAYKSQRSPSYTDRILYKANHNLSKRIDLKAYGPIDRFTTSDHKPVRGAYEIHLNPKLLGFQSTQDVCFGVVPISTLWRSITELGAKLNGSSPSLQLSCSSIECVMEKEGLLDFSHTPYLSASFMTTPIHAIEVEDANETMDLSTRNCPRTEAVKTNTLHAQWEKTVEFTIRPYSKFGIPLDLTGAMLHVVIYDSAKENSKPLGSCSLNLASLIMDSIGKKGEPAIVKPTGNAKFFEEVLTKNGKEVGCIQFITDLQFQAKEK
mmetsp:Transcript_18010/g.44820  ORF Transcript_18010/g.44820 Transcript_18010/m.44820 type:complete len:591 (+) Transcript_18010:58-1830(+)